MKGTKQFDIDGIEPNHWEPDPHYIAKILSELLSRQYGYPVELVLTPKTPKSQEDGDGKQIPSADKIQQSNAYTIQQGDDRK